MALTGSAFAPVRNNSVSSDDSDQVKTAIHFPKSESSFSPPTLMPWWAAEAESHLVKPPMWSWWGLQNQRLSSMYRFASSFPNATDDEKPSQSYIGLIAEAILSSPEEKLILSDIYGFILANYPYFRNKGTGWRNSIRHNLSLNDCFIKSGRSQNGKGHFWAVNLLYLEDFRRGDFRRKRTYKRPSRGKKARGKLDALMRKKDSRCHESLGIKDHEKKLHRDSCNSAVQDERRFVDDTSIHQSLDNVKEKDTFMEQDHLPAQEAASVHAHERVVPSSPDWVTDEYQDVDVCKTDFEKDPSKSLAYDAPKEAMEDRDSKERIDKTRRSTSFDMDRLLAPAEKSAKDFGILREMYPMYYNIMSLGVRNLEPVDYYGAAPSFCSHCCSMIGSYPPTRREIRHIHPAMAPVEKPSLYDECR